MKQKATLPQTALGLRAWLKGTVQGRELLGMLTKEAIEEAQEEKCRACENIRPYPKVLVVLRRLGRFPGAQVYAEEGVTIRFLELPDVSAEGKIGILVEELIELRLPRNWRHLMDLSANRITIQVFRGMTLQESLQHTERAVALREIREIQDIERTKR